MEKTEYLALDNTLYGFVIYYMKNNILFKKGYYVGKKLSTTEKEYVQNNYPFYQSIAENEIAYLNEINHFLVIDKYDVVLPNQEDLLEVINYYNATKDLDADNSLLELRDKAYLERRLSVR